MVAKLYLDTANLVWNGHPVGGVGEIMKFLEALPTSEHMVDAVDAQPIPSKRFSKTSKLLLVSILPMNNKI